MKRQLPSQTLEEQFLNPDTRRAPISETIRLGAQLMIQKAVELEVTEFLGRDHYQRRGESLLRGYRNGYADKQVQTGEGSLHLKMPQVRDTLAAFESVWRRALVRRSDKLAALIPQLYVKGMSTRDIEAALTEVIEVEGVSKSTVSVLCKQLHQDFERWQNRDLSDQDILLYLGLVLSLYGTEDVFLGVARPRETGGPDRSSSSDAASRRHRG